MLNQTSMKRSSFYTIWTKLLIVITLFWGSKGDDNDLFSYNGRNIVEDSRRGLRRVVPSPQPREVVEWEAIAALMDAGVPIKAPVAGIAMGLVKENDQVAILSDILGDEDHTGDMDFKVTGTETGITALQMDIKIHELSKEIMQKALEQARLGRLFILKKMLEAISEPRKEISPYAPTITTIKINPDKIREVIGPGGKIIRGIQSETNTSIEIDDSGLVKIAAYSKEEGLAAIKMVEDLTREPEVGAVYEGTVVKVTDFGAFVQILPGTDGLVHISQLANRRITKVTDVVKEGDLLKVKVLEISRDGKIRLSHKAILEEKHGANHR